MRRGEPRAKLHHWYRVPLVSVPIVVLVAIILGGVYRASWTRADAERAHGTTARTPAPSAEVGAQPRATLSEDAPSTGGTAATQPPSRQLVLAFELAFFTPDPTLRIQRLQVVATPQYIADTTTATSPVQANGLVDAIDAKKSVVQVTCDQAYLSCTEQSQVWLVMSRHGTPVQAFLAPPHATEWIFTTTGWKAAHATDPR